MVVLGLCLWTPILVGRALLRRLYALIEFGAGASTGGEGLAKELVSITPFAPSAAQVHEFHNWTVGLFALLGTLRLWTLAKTRIGHVTLYSVLVEWPHTLVKTLVLASFTMLLWPCLCGYYIASLVYPLLVPHTQIPITFAYSSWMVGVLILRVVLVARSYLVSSTARLAMVNLMLARPFELVLPPSRGGGPSGTPHFWQQVMGGLLLPWTLKAMFVVYAPVYAVLLLSPLASLSRPQLLMLQRWSPLASLIPPSLLLLVSFARIMHGRIREGVLNDEFGQGRQLRNLEQRQLIAIASKQAPLREGNEEQAERCTPSKSGERCN